MEETVGSPPRKRRAVKKGSTAPAAAGCGGGQTFSDLPSHIICDIVSRLPVKSIFSCKQVCRSWHNTLRQPYFARWHLSRSPLSLILHRRSNRKDPCSFGVLELGGDPAGLRRRKLTTRFTSDIHIPRSRIEMVGTCNGSICLTDRRGFDTVIVCNPIRAQYSILPKPPVPSSDTRLGFGYSPSAEQFKVVRFVDTKTKSGFGWDIIFTLGNDDAWRSIGGTGQPSPVNLRFLNFRFAHLNGALHWLGKDDDSRFIICYFDIENEQFGNLPFPSHIGPPSMHRRAASAHLGVVDNSLYISDEYSSRAVVNIWVMEDYRDVGSWTLKWVFQKPFPHGLDGELKPIKTLKDGTMLIIFHNTTLASYNPETRVFEKIKYHLVSYWDESVADVPSFLDPMNVMR